MLIMEFRDRSACAFTPPSHRIVVSKSWQGERALPNCQYHKSNKIRNGKSSSLQNLTILFVGDVIIRNNCETSHHRTIDYISLFLPSPILYMLMLQNIFLLFILIIFSFFIIYFFYILSTILPL